MCAFSEWAILRLLIQIKGDIEKMATKDELKAAVSAAVSEVKTELQTVAASETAQVATKIKELQDLLEAGQLTEADLTEVSNMVKGIAPALTGVIDAIQA